MANPVKTGDAKLWVFDHVFKIMTARLPKAMILISWNSIFGSPVDRNWALLLYCTIEMKWK
jgi:hypothetical protein